jgi:tetratricopeptide (TPR) repeat protein/membrane protease YdiL (CAAX protease family)
VARLKVPFLFGVLLGVLFDVGLFAQPAPSPESLIALGQSKLRADDPDGAGRVFRQALSADAANAAAWRGMGESLYKSKQYPQALACFQKEASLEPAEVTARLWSGNCQYALGNFQEAAKSYGDFVAVHPDSVSGMDGLGKAFYKLKQYEKALPFFQKEVSLVPDRANGHYWLGCCLSRQAHFREAETEFRKSIGLDAKQADAYDQLGYCLIHLGRHSDAIPVYNKAQSLAGPDVDRLFWLGYCHVKARNYSLGRALLQEYVSQLPRDADGHYWLANALYELNNYEEARDSLRKAILLNPNHLDAQELLGDTLIALKAYDQAADAYAQAIRIKPDDFYAHLWRGRALMMDVQLHEGVQEIEKACRLDPRDRAAKRLLVSGYLVTSQYRKAWELYPVPYATGVAVLLMAFGAGSMVMLRKSFRPSAATAPGLWFSLGWFVYFWDGQVMFIFLAGLFTSAFASFNVVAGMTLGPLPLLAAALTAFPKQPWGRPFDWPRIFPWKLLGLGCVGLFSVFIFDASYVTVAPALTHLPPGHPRNVPFIEQMLLASPPLAVLAVVILAPVAEEILFRGLLFGAMESRCGKWAILWSAVAFAAAHFDPYYFVPLVALGSLFGWARWRSGTIWVSAMMHMLNNAFAISSM